MKIFSRPADLPTYNRINILRNIINAGTDTLPSERARKVRIVNALSMITAFLAAVIGTMFYFSNGLKEILTGAWAETFAFTLVIILNRFRFYNAASIGVLVIHCLGALYFHEILGSLIDISLIIAFMFGMCFLVYSTSRMQAIGAAITLSTYFLLQADLIPQIIPTLNMPQEQQQLIRSVADPAFMFFNVLVFVGLLLQYRKLMNRLNAYVHQFSHELRNNLNSQTLIVDKLQREIRKNPSLSQLLPLVEELQISTDTMAEISNNALSIGEMEAGDRRTLQADKVNIKLAIGRMIAIHRLKAERNQLSLSLSIAEDFPNEIILNKDGLNKILANLIVNAIKYADQNTQISIAVTLEKNESFRITVTNSCPDIPKEVLAKLFDRFFTAKNKNVEGSGLGLYIVQEQVARLNGTITAISQNRKTSFVVVLPLKTASLFKVDLSNVHVVVVDDSPAMVRYASNALEAYGCTVSTASEGAQLFDMLQDQVSLPDAILLDRHLQDVSGIKILKSIKSNPRLKSIPVIIYTGDNADQQALIDAGASAVQLKPSEPRALAELIGQLI
ncbi:hybrid sensor histidine kinase/response regulator [Chitinophaga horti]|uniref:histidine kinase n=1 Tax=Chitinophaga horti TaxID=2920382 RepID=A0ABY6IY00_9BACT|nr:hybrid sensor histidine kinase/response regulator [Chitinophaga horti]UYQ92143.1 hybrid sensor histidine kinase/response regulator [Chitinophaga horti]